MFFFAWNKSKETRQERTTKKTEENKERKEKTRKKTREEKKGDNQTLTEIPSCSGANSLNFSTSKKHSNKNNKALGPSETTLSSIFLFFVFLLLLHSSLLTSCFFLVVCLFLFSFLSFYSLLFCCSHPCCPLLMYSLSCSLSLYLLVLVLHHLFPTYSSFYSSPSFFFFLIFLLLSMYCSNMTTGKRNKQPELLFTDKTGRA